MMKGMMMRRVLFLLAGICCSGALYAQSDRIEILQRMIEKDQSPAAYYEMAQLALENKLPGGSVRNQELYQSNLFQAAELGYPKAQLDAAVILLTRTQLLDGPQRAFAWLNNLINRTPARDFTIADICSAYYWDAYCMIQGNGIRPNGTLAQKYMLLATIGSNDARFYQAQEIFRNHDKKTPCPELGLLLLYEIYVSNPERSKEITAFIAKHKISDSFQAFLDKKSRAGDPIATIMLADNLMEGAMFPMQRNKAIEYYERALKLGNTHAALQMIDYYITSGQRIRNQERIRQYYQAALAGSETRKQAAAYFAADALEKKEFERAFYFFMVAGNTEKAREAWNGIPNKISLGPQELYLLAKELPRGSNPVHAKRYLKQLQLAANAGYPLAVLELADFRNNQGQTPVKLTAEALIKAMEALPPEEKNAAWYYNLGRYQLRAKHQANALANITKAADLGNVHAMDLLIRSYMSGSKELGVGKDFELAAYYRDMLLEKDCTMEHPIYFSSFFEDFSASGKTDEKIRFMYRSLGLSSYADYAFAKALMEGDSSIQVSKNFQHGLIMLHIAARDANFKRALKDIIRIFATKDKATTPKAQRMYDPAMVERYQNLMK